MPGIGLQPFCCSELSKFDSIVFTKWIDDDLLNGQSIIQVRYADQKFKSLNTSFVVALTGLG